MPAVDQRLLELILSQSTLTKAVTLPFFILYLHRLSLKKLYGMESMFRSLMWNHSHHWLLIFFIMLLQI